MALPIGGRVGVYEVTAQIGAGGMGEVYRARDTRLGRDVALKILPDAFATDPDRLARFQREAKTLASLNHPNIGGIHGLEEGNGVTALVMELVEGEDLAQRIARGAIPLDEALPGCRRGCLRGGRARRHREACNRGHRLLRCCVEVSGAGASHDTSPNIIARDRGPRKISAITDSNWRLEQDLSGDAW